MEMYTDSKYIGQVMRTFIVFSFFPKNTCPAPDKEKNLQTGAQGKKCLLQHIANFSKLPSFGGGAHERNNYNNHKPTVKHKSVFSDKGMIMIFCAHILMGVRWLYIFLLLVFDFCFLICFLCLSISLLVICNLFSATQERLFARTYFCFLCTFSYTLD